MQRQEAEAERDARGLRRAFGTCTKEGSQAEKRGAKLEIVPRSVHEQVRRADKQRERERERQRQRQKEEEIISKQQQQQQVND